ncbi:hypothetical protein, partial [Roseibacillus persicicus]|uniref:hypothetical protein n=1 Tax=Roseibacillus persicicus TaxID=454148 RepID=UPI0028103486
MSKPTSGRSQNSPITRSSQIRRLVCPGALPRAIIFRPVGADVGFAGDVLGRSQNSPITRSSQVRRVVRPGVLPRAIIVRPGGAGRGFVSLFMNSGCEKGAFFLSSLAAFRRNTEPSSPNGANEGSPGQRPGLGSGGEGEQAGDLFVYTPPAATERNVEPAPAGDRERS